MQKSWKIKVMIIIITDVYYKSKSEVVVNFDQIRFLLAFSV